MNRYLFIPGLLFLPLMASAAVIVVNVERRISGFPSNAGFDLDADGVRDLQFRTSSIATTDVPSSSGADQLEIQPGAGMEWAYLGNSTLQPGALLGLNLPVVNTEGSRGSWSDYSSWISSRNYSFINPGNVSFQHFANGNSEGYWGFRLPDVGGGWRFGYIHFQFVDWKQPPRAAFGFAGDPMLVGWALETSAGIPIKVVPIPEGSVVGLLLGMLVAAGGYRFRQ